MFERCEYLKEIVINTSGTVAIEKDAFPEGADGMKIYAKKGYTFLGIYKLAPSSTPQRLVWQRIAERLDLRHLDQLDLLRQ